MAITATILISLTLLWIRVLFVTLALSQITLNDVAVLSVNETIVDATLNQKTFEHFARVAKLDGHHVVFGKILSGMEVVRKIEAQGQDSGEPKGKVIIFASGEVSL